QFLYGALAVQVFVVGFQNKKVFLFHEQVWFRVEVLTKFNKDHSARFVCRTVLLMRIGVYSVARANIELLLLLLLFLNYSKS
ncbi:hypothetical protein BpHYR1_011978, partial [Brachionus plicatilis]